MADAQLVRTISRLVSVNLGVWVIDDCAVRGTRRLGIGERSWRRHTSNSCCRPRADLRTSVIPRHRIWRARGIVSELRRRAEMACSCDRQGENHAARLRPRPRDIYDRVATGPSASVLSRKTTSGRDVNSIARNRAEHEDAAGLALLEEARKKMGAYADALALDQRVRCARSRALGWSPALHSVSNSVPRLLEEFRRAPERAA